MLAPQVKTAAEDFRQAGYRTAAFVSGFPLDRRFGFDRGFEMYDDHLPKGNDARRTPYVERFADATTDAALRWLRPAPATGPAAAPWFLWVHYYDPARALRTAGRSGGALSRIAYDGEIAFVDRQLARCPSALEPSGESARTIVLVTADHGESLGEHGEGTHGIFIYDATLRVPWIMAGPRSPRGACRGRSPDRSTCLPTLARLRRPSRAQRCRRPVAPARRRGARDEG